MVMVNLPMRLEVSQSEGTVEAYLRSALPRFSQFQAGEAAPARIQMLLTDARVRTVRLRIAK